jgi:protein-disulfide isomerase
LPLIIDNYVATGEVAYIFRNYPLPSHAQAMISAEAAECGGLQGKFWEMHDKVFLNQSDWSGNDQALEVFLGYADELGLDTTAFGTCMSEHQTQQKILEDQVFGQQIGVPATPAFLVRGKGVEQPYPIVGAYPFEEFEKAIQTVSNQ